MQNKKDSVVSRRDFIVQAALTSTGLIVGQSVFGKNQRQASAATDATNSVSSNKRKLGSLEVSAQGLGCMPMVGFYGVKKDRAELIKVIRTAYERGVTFFDTAEIYGPFIDEEILGEGVKPFRDKIIIATKFGYDLDPNATPRGRLNSRPEHIKKAVDGSLKRLQSDYIDLYYQHRVDPGVPIEDVAGAIKELIQAGKVRHWGLSEPGLTTIRRAHSVHPLTAIQNEYSLWTRDPEAAVLPVCEELGIGFVCWSPLGYGFFAGAINEETRFAQGDFRAVLPRLTPENIKQNLPMLDYVKQWAKRKNITPAQLSLAWLGAQKPWIVPIPGTTQLAHLQDNLKATSVTFSTDELKEFTTGLSKLPIVGPRNAKFLLDGMGVEAPAKA